LPEALLDQELPASPPESSPISLVSSDQRQTERGRVVDDLAGVGVDDALWMALMYRSSVVPKGAVSGAV